MCALAEMPPSIALSSNASKVAGMLWRNFGVGGGAGSESTLLLRWRRSWVSVLSSMVSWLRHISCAHSLRLGGGGREIFGGGPAPALWRRRCMDNDVTLK